MSEKYAPVVELFPSSTSRKSLGVGKPRRAGFTHHDVHLLIRAYLLSGEMGGVLPRRGEGAAAKRCLRAGWLFVLRGHDDGYVLTPSGMALVDKLVSFLEYAEPRARRALTGER